MRPLVENFIPFSPDRIDMIRLNRGLGLTADPITKTRKKSSTVRKGPKLDAKAVQVIAGLDEETQRMIQEVLRSK